jgi:hypothetical protein
MADAISKAADIIKADNLPASEIPTSSTVISPASAVQTVFENAVVSLDPHVLANPTAGLSSDSLYVTDPSSAHPSTSSTSDSTLNSLSTVPSATVTMESSFSPLTSTDLTPTPSQSDLSTSIPAIRTTTGLALSSHPPLSSVTTSPLTTSLSSALIETPLSTVTQDSATFHSPPEVTPSGPPASSLLEAEQQNTSAVAIMTSIIGNPDASEGQKGAAIDAFIHWVLSFMT